MTARHRNRLIIGGFAVALLALGLLGGRGVAERSLDAGLTSAGASVTSSGRGPDVSAAVVSPMPDRLLRAVRPVGDRLRYRFDLMLDGRLILGAQLAGAFGVNASGRRLDQRQQLRGRVALEVHGRTSRGNLIGVRFEGLAGSIASGGHSTDLPAGHLQALQEAPTLLLVGASGRLQRIHYPDGTGVSQRRLLFALLTSFQVLLPQQEQARWRVREERGFGRLLIGYRRLDRQRLERRPLAVERLDASGVFAGGGGRCRVGGLQTVQLDDEQVMLRLRGREHVECTSDGFGARLTQRTQLELIARERGVLTKDDRRRALAQLSRRKPTIPGNAEQRAADARAQQRGQLLSEIRGATLEGLLREALSGGQPGALGQRRLGLLLRSDARQLDTVARRIAGRGSLAEKRVLLGALGTAGTPEAQALLVTLLDDPQQDAALRRTALFSLLQVARSDPATIQAVERLVAVGASPLRGTAVQVLGSLLRKSSDGQSRRRALATLDRLVESDDRASAERYLVALGNSGLPEVQQRIERFLDSPDSGLRYRAVRALGRLRGHPGQARLRQVLAGDSEPSVRVQALRALARSGEAENLTAVGRVLRQDRTERVRLVALEILGRRLDGAPGLRRQIEAAVADRSARVSEAARRILARS